MPELLPIEEEIASILAPLEAERGQEEDVATGEITAELHSKVAEDYDRALLGLGRRAREYAKRIEALRAQKRKLVEEYGYLIQRIEASQNLVYRELEWLVREQMFGGGKKSIDIPGGGRARLTKVPERTKVADADALEEWLMAHKEFMAFSRRELDKQAALEHSHLIAARHGGEIPAGIVTIPERQSFSFAPDK